MIVFSKEVRKVIYRVADIREKSEKDYETAYNSLPLWRREKADKYRFLQDRKRSVFAYELLISMLSDYLEAEDNAFEIYEDERGKLRLKNSELGFNISHSGAFVACAIHEGEVGIDIEEKRELSPRLFESVLSNPELKILTRGEEVPTKTISKDLPMAAEFLRFWTVKEAYLKYTGEGLSGGIKHVKVSLTPGPTILDKDINLISEDMGEYLISVVY